MANLGNLFFTLGLDDGTFRKRLEEDVKKAREINREIKELLSSMSGGVSADKAALSGARVQALMERNAAKVRQIERQTVAAVQESEERKLAIRRRSAAQENAINEKKAAALKLLSAQEAVAESRRKANLALEAVRNERLNRMQSSLNSTAASTNRQLSVTGGLIREMSSYAAGFVSLFAAKQLISSLVRIRGEFDMSLISLKAMVQSAPKAIELFNQIKGLSVVSPFTFMDLTSYIKQLSAYQIPTDELFDTTKRLADLSAGVGVDMGRIILAYGQVRSAAFLRGQELRQFTEAGIPLVQALADKFSELEDRVVSAGEVFDKISNKEVSFEMVKDVISDLTDKGGKFYMMQEKQAESLKGMISNLVDQYDIMMNRIGENYDGQLKGSVKTLTLLMENSDKLLALMKALVPTLGLYRLGVLMTRSAIGAETKAVMENILAGKRRQADMLLATKSHKNLTESEKELVKTSGRLTDADLMQAAASGKLNKEMALRMTRTGIITEGQARQLAGTLKLTEAEIAQASGTKASARGFSVFAKDIKKAGAAADMMRGRLSRLGSSISSAFMSVFSLPNLLLGVVSAGLYMLADLFQEQDELKRKADETAKSIRESYENLRKFVADNPIEMTLKGGGEDQVKKLADKYEEQLKESHPLSLTLTAQAGTIEDPGERLKFLTEQVDMLQRAQMVAADLNDVFLEADKETDGWFDEAASVNLEDYAGALSELKKEIGEVSMLDILNRMNFPGLEKDAQAIREMADAGKSVYDVYDYIVKNSDDYRKALMFVFSPQVKNATEDLKKAKDTAVKDVRDLYNFVKMRLEAGNIDIGSEQGRMVTEILKKEWLNGLVGVSEEGKKLFSIEFDSVAYGASEAFVKAIGDAMQSADSGGVIREFVNSGVWTEAVNTLAENAKRQLIGQFPEMKEEIEASIERMGGISVAIKAYFDAADQLSGWKKELNDDSGGRFKLEIEGAESLDRLIDTVKQKRGELKKQMETLAPVLSVNGFDFETGTLPAVVVSDTANAAAEAYNKTKSDLEELEKLGNRLNISWNDGKGESAPSKDAFTESLKKRLDLIRQARQEYGKLSEAMGEADAKSNVMAAFGLGSEDGKYLADGGEETLYADFLEKVKSRNTEAAESVRATWNDELRKIRLESLADGIGKALSEAEDRIRLDKENFGVFRRAFDATGNKGFAMNVAFGGAVAWDSEIAKFREDLSKALADSGKGLSVDEVLGMDRESLEKVFGEEKGIVRYYEEIREAGKKLKEENLNDLLEVLENNRTFEERLEEIERERQRMLGLVQGDTSLSPEQKKQKTKAVNEGQDAKKSKILFEQFKETSGWARVFDDLDRVSTATLDSMAAKIEEFAKKQGLSVTETKELVQAMRKLREESTERNPFATFRESLQDIRDAREVLDRVNANGGTYTFTKDELGYKAGETVDANQAEDKQQKAYSDLNNSTQGIINKFNALAEAADMLGGFFEAIGKGTWLSDVGGVLSSGLSGASSGMSMATTLFGSLGSAAGPIGAAVGGVLSAVTSIFSLKSKRLQESIEESERAVDALSAAFDRMNESIERFGTGELGVRSTLALYEQLEQQVALAGSELNPSYRAILESLRNPQGYLGSLKGGDDYRELVRNREQRDALNAVGYGETDSLKQYQAQYAALVAQRAETEKMLAEEEEKGKDADDGKIEDYQNQLAELNEQVRYFVEDLAKELYSIDTSSWAGQISDSLMNAFANGEDAAEAFKNTTNDILRSVASSILKNMVIAPMLESLQEKLFGDENGEGGVFKSFEDVANNGALVAQTISDWFTEEADPMLKASEEFWKAFNEATDGALEATEEKEKEGLSATISGITEDQANLLASYVNAIRADVAAILAYYYSLPGHQDNGDVMATISVKLGEIAANTLRCANNTDTIVELISSVITAGANGKKLRV